MRHLVILLALASAHCAATTPLPPAPEIPTQQERDATVTPDDDPVESVPRIYVRLEHTRRAEPADVDVSIPIFASPEPELASALKDINADLRAVIARNIGSIERLASDEAETAPTHPYELHVTCRPALLSRRVISVACDAWQYTGGAHGMHGTTGHNYFVAEGGAEPMALAELLEDPDLGGAAIAKLATADLAQQGASLIANEELTLKAEHLDNFTLTPVGLVLHFEPYAVGSYAEGDYEVVLDYVALRPLWRRGETRRALAGATSPKVDVVLDFDA